MEQEKNKIEKIYSPIEIDFKKSLTQQKILIQGIPIYFPYNPYPPQILYMEKVISALNKKGSLSALESPTGTGKTLCLVCAILAWVKFYNKKISIYYCTRTVSQINNLLKELNKTCYVLNTSFIASKKYTCIYFTKQEKKDKSHTQLNDICDELKKNMFSKYNKKETDEDRDKEKKDQAFLYEPVCKYYKIRNEYNNYNIS